MGYSHLFQLGLAQKLEGAGIVCLLKSMDFFGISNCETRNGQKCLKLLKSTLGQVKLSIEVQYITVTQFSGFLEGLFSDSATVLPAGGREGGYKFRFLSNFL